MNERGSGRPVVVLEWSGPEILSGPEFGTIPRKGGFGGERGGDFQGFEEEKGIRKEEKCPEGGVGNTPPLRIHRSHRRLSLGNNRREFAFGYSVFSE
jgi:hypothetical protein